jgi:hypothetical protein
MALATSNVNTVTDSFQNWIDKTNELLAAYSTTIVTTAANSEGGSTTGNGTVNGIFTANSVTVNGNTTFGLRGGNTTTANVLYITSNVSIGNTTVNTVFSTTTIDTDLQLTVAGNTTLSGALQSISGNANFDSGVLFVDATNNRVGVNNTAPGVAFVVTGAANVSVSVNSALLTVGTSFVANTTGAYHTGTINSSSFTTTGLVANATVLVPTSNTVLLGNATGRFIISANTGNFSGNVVITGTANVSSTLNVTGSVVVNTFATFLTFANTDMGSNTTASCTAISFPKTSYQSGELLVYTNKGSEYQITKILFAHNGTDVNQTIYGTLVSPSSSSELANNITLTVNGANVDVNLRQRVSNSSVKILANMLF